MSLIDRANRLEEVRSAIQEPSGDFVISVLSGSVMRVARDLGLTQMDMRGVKEYQTEDEELGRVIVREL